MEKSGVFYKSRNFSLDLENPGILACFRWNLYFPLQKHTHDKRFFLTRKRKEPLKAEEMALPALQEMVGYLPSSVIGNESRSDSIGEICRSLPIPIMGKALDCAARVDTDVDSIDGMDSFHSNRLVPSNF